MWTTGPEPPQDERPETRGMLGRDEYETRTIWEGNKWGGAGDWMENRCGSSGLERHTGTEVTGQVELFKIKQEFDTGSAGKVQRRRNMMDVSEFHLRSVSR